MQVYRRGCGVKGVEHNIIWVNSNRTKIIVQSKIFGEYEMGLKVVLEPSDEGGYTVYVPSLPGCISEGDTIDYG